MLRVKNGCGLPLKGLNQSPQTLSQLHMAQVARPEIAQFELPKKLLSGQVFQLLLT
jgi:hypothetical protein